MYVTHIDIVIKGSDSHGPNSISKLSHLTVQKFKSKIKRPGLGTNLGPVKFIGGPIIVDKRTKQIRGTSRKCLSPKNT